MTDYSAKAREIEILKDRAKLYATALRRTEMYGNLEIANFIEDLMQTATAAHLSGYLSGYEQAKFDIATWHLKQSIAAHEADFYTLAEQHIEYAEKIRFFQQPSNKE